MEAYKTIITDNNKVYIFPDFVRKQFINREIYWAGKLNNPEYFAEPLSTCDASFIVYKNCGESIGNWKKITNKIDYLKFVVWLKGLEKELVKLNVNHRDINPSNILWDGKFFTLIDTEWMREVGKKCYAHPKLNKYFGCDKDAIDKLSKISINHLIAQLGTKRYPGSSIRSGWAYHPIAFPEFSPPIHKSSAIGELEEINKYCDLGNKTILDIGSSVGYFTFNLAKSNNVTGVEADPAAWEVAEALRVYKCVHNISFVNNDVYNYVNFTNDTKYDLVVMLNVHMWLHKKYGNDPTNNLMRALAKRCKQMIFQTAGAESGGKYQVKDLNSKETINEYLNDNGFHSKFIRTTKEHGGLRHLFLCKGAI